MVNNNHGYILTEKKKKVILEFIKNFRILAFTKTGIIYLDYICKYG